MLFVNMLVRLLLQFGLIIEFITTSCRDNIHKYFHAQFRSLELDFILIIII
jgi:hypothetical protein